MKIEEQVKAWKQEHGTVFLFPFEDGNNVYFRKPNRKELKLILSKAKEGPLSMAESFVKNCLLGGDLTEAQITDDKSTEYIAQVAATIDDLLGTKRQEIKKL